MVYLKKNNKKNISISVVSHKNARELFKLLKDLDKFNRYIKEIIITYNTNEKHLNVKKFKNIIKIIKNKSKKGFGENHNNAFRKTSGKFFCILNPDISIKNNVFLNLQKFCEKKEKSIISPLVLGDKFTKNIYHKNNLTFFNLIKRYFFNNEVYEKIDLNKSYTKTTWLGGMFIFCKSTIFKKLKGFNIKYFLYCEDVDLSLRAKKKNIEIFIIPKIKVFHEGRRKSHKDFWYMFIHLKSLIIFAIDNYKYFFRF